MQPEFDLSGMHLARVMGQPELCGPVTTREVALCDHCQDPIWGKIHEVGGRRVCGRCAADRRRELED